MHLKYICITSGEIDIFMCIFYVDILNPIPKYMKNDVCLYHM